MTAPGKGSENLKGIATPAEIDRLSNLISTLNTRLDRGVIPNLRLTPQTQPDIQKDRIEVGYTYYDKDLKVTRSWNGTAWVLMSLPAGGAASQILQAPATAGGLPQWASAPLTVLEPGRGAIIVGDIDDAWNKLGIGTIGQVLTVAASGADPEWANLPAVGMTNPMTTPGDIILGGTAGAPSRLAIGASSKYLKSNGSTASWEDLPATITDFADNAFTIHDNSDSTKKIAFEASLITTGVTRTLTVQDLSGTIALLEASQTWTGLNRFSGGYIQIDDKNGSGYKILLGAGPIGISLTADRELDLPDTDGTLLVGSVSVTQSLKLSTSSLLVASTASSGACFVDTTTSTKKMRMVLSGAVGNNSITVTNTAARNYGLGDYNGNIALVGDNTSTAASGKMCKKDLTGQTSAIGSTNLTSSALTGFYEVEVIAMCTTASGSGSPTLDVTLGWTDNVGATTEKTINALSLSATGRAHGATRLRVNSGEISFSTTINSASGSPQYALYIRVIYLG